MSFKLSFDACVSCRNGSVTITDTSEWGSPNPEIADVDVATITVYGHDGTEYPAVDVMPTLPAVDGEFILLPTDLGLSEGSSFPEGILTIDYFVSGSVEGVVFTYKARRIVPVLCSVECCVNEKMSEIDPVCGCSSGIQKKNIQAMLALSAIRAAIACGKVSQARSLYDRLYALCNNNCKNC